MIINNEKNLPTLEDLKLALHRFCCRFLNTKSSLNI